MTTQNKNTNKITKNITNMHEMNITRSLEDKKKCHYDQKWSLFHFYTFFQSLTLHNAFASLGSISYLGTLNPKLPKTCLVLQK